MKKNYIITVTQIAELKFQIEAETVELAKELASYDQLASNSVTLISKPIIKNNEILKVEQENNIILE